jgi:hydroxyquinol 1,2-dioxygenase
METPAPLPARSTKAEDITEATLRAFEDTPNPRIKELLTRAVKHLHAFASEVN